LFLKRIWLTNFRNYDTCDCEFASDGLTVVEGPNGQGKTNLLEAIGYTATLRSFRGASPEVMIKKPHDSGVIRGLGEREGRELLTEAELNLTRRSRTLINKQPLRRMTETQDLLAITVFSPDDLSIIKGGPALRRQFIDDLLADGDPAMRAVQRDYERVVKQRNTLLRQAANRLTPDVALTLDVWDSKLSDLGETVGDARQQIIEELQPFVESAYQDLADSETISRVSLAMSASWRAKNGGVGLASALTEARSADLARQITSVGPHRDEIELEINGLPARTQASQGEQRTLTLALRLAGHRLLERKIKSQPILILDDVFSELDEDRSRRLVSELPKCQTFLSTANALPVGLEPAGYVRVSAGKVLA
jgi:DNA replication and repair protein RecF